MTAPDTRTPSYGRVDTEFGRRLATTPAADDGPVWMVNLMSYREHAVYDGSPDHQVSGREADDRYAPTEILAEIGARVVFAGDVESQLLGDAPRWDRVAVVRYPTRRSFIEMQMRDDFRARHVHKEAGMAATIVVGCVPAELPPEAVHALDAGGAVEWSDVEHPPSGDDGHVVVVHVIRFAPGGRDRMTGYHDHAFAVASRHGARLGGWFDVEGTIVGDGRAWDQVRFNVFPSRRAFDAVLADPARLAAQREHRTAAVADTYTLVVRPFVDELDGTPPEARLAMGG